MKNWTIYRETKDGWEKVYKSKTYTFPVACEMAKKLEAETGVSHCVNK